AGSVEEPQGREGRTSPGCQRRAAKLPMPPEEELELRFDTVLNTMNLPPDKVKILSQYDNDKKWDLICDQERFQVKNPPSAYVEKLRNSVEHGLGRKFKRRVQEPSQVLRELEISLRTNHIGWAQEFLSEENGGLDVLVEYLSVAVTHDVDTLEDTAPPPDRSKGLDKPAEDECIGSNSPTHTSRTSKTFTARRVRVSNRKTLRSSRVANQTDDVHLCVMCLRAIMNYQTGFDLVMKHPRCVNEITLSLNNRNPRTKALVLELLAAVCLVRGGHDIILSAFDNFQEVCGEKSRFEKLMEYFCREDRNIDFMVACMQFINIMVHSVENMNFRVHLQYQFSCHGLDEYLEQKLKSTESDRLLVQIQAYLDNMFDVGALLEDAETKNTLLEHLDEVQEHNSQLNSRLQESEREAVEKMSELETKLIQATKEVEILKVTLLQQREQERELEKERERERERSQRAVHPGPEGAGVQGSGPGGAGPGPDEAFAIWTPGSLGGPCHPTGDRGPVTPPPSEHLPPMVESLPTSAVVPNSSASFAAPCWRVTPAPGQDGSSGCKKKKAIQTKYRMPLLNWQVLAANQVPGTVFNELDDGRVLQELNMAEFEEQFKTKAQPPPVEAGTLRAKLAHKTPSKVSLMEPNRAKNLAITLRKEGTAACDICPPSRRKYDLRALSLDFLELLERFIPTDYEMKLIQDFEHEGRAPDELSEEDRFMMRFGKIPRLPQRISTLTFMGNFPESFQLIQPQLDALIAASMSVKSSSKLKKVLEIVLAFGNYMNSSKRGLASGFRLQSLDLLLDTKSTDRKQTLLHFIANVIQEKYPDVNNFHSELHFLDKAALVSLDSVLQDLRALQRGMELTRREFSAEPENLVLHTFLTSNSELLDALTADGKTAQDVYESTVEYFGENCKTTPPSMFFPVFIRFIKAYKQAEQENQQKKQQKVLNLQTSTSPNKEDASGNKIKLQQVDLIAELKKRQMSPQVREGKDGAIEDIITGISRTDGLTAADAAPSGRRDSSSRSHQTSRC
uniref:Formin like 1 n=1 Tax=Tetraodon nigroviridis TaxID=99883 RepID=H3D2S7_TETNG